MADASVDGSSPSRGPDSPAAVLCPPVISVPGDVEHRFVRFMQHLPGLAWIKDLQGRYLFVNDAAAHAFGRSREQLLGATDHDVFPPETADLFRENDLKALAEGALQTVESLTHPDGVVHQSIVSKFPIPAGNDGAAVLLGGMAIDVTERLEVEAALKQAKEQAEIANRAKDRFLAVLSHELRTPLTPVLMSVSALETDPQVPPRLRDELAMIRRNVELETKLIDDLLDVSRVTSGKIRLAPQMLDLNASLRHVCDICRPQMVERDIRVQASYDPRAGRVAADPARLQQVLWNVLKNAAKFTPQGGTIRVMTSRAADDRVIVQIADDGVGIEPDVLPRIFDAFEQGDASITRQFGGLGLGLAISRALIELHGGTIRAESGGTGLGSIFTIELSAVIEPGEGARAGSDGGNGAAGAAVVAGAGAVVGADAASARSQPSEIDRRPLRLLLVEDHADTARTLGMLLRARGYAVETAGTAAVALDLASRQPFDLLLSDIGLPDATGYDIMRTLRERGAAVRGIAMSGYGMDEDVRKSHEAGFSDHFTKPINLPELEAAIRKLAAHPA